MQNKFVIKVASCMMLAMGLLATGCTNEENEEMSIANETRSLTKAKVVDILKNMDFDNALSKEIHGYVTNSLATGRDEYVRIDNLLSNETRANGQSLFATQFVNLFMEKYITRSADAKDMLKELVNSDFIIYWPYSEDWDGKELPTLVAAPDDDDAEEAMGTKIIHNGNGISYEEVLVNEDYTMEHPVWVINTKVEKNNVVYVTKSDADDDAYYAPKYATRATNDTIHVWKLQKMQVTHQYDGPFKGGPDIEIHISYPTGPGSVNTSTIHQVSFSRKDVKKKRWKELNLLLNSDWTRNQIDNGMVLVEQDWDGVSSTISTDLSLSYQDANGMTTSTNVSITYSGNDEFIGKQVLARSYMLHHSELSFDNGQVNMIAPIEVEVY